MVDLWDEGGRAGWRKWSGRVAISVSGRERGRRRRRRRASRTRGEGLGFARGGNPRCETAASEEESNGDRAQDRICADER